MFVLSKIFGKYPRVKILEAFVDHINDALSIADIHWLTDVPKTAIYDCISKLLEENIVLKGYNIGNVQFYYLNKDSQEVQILTSIVNFIIVEKLNKKLEERGLEPIEA